MRQKIKTNRFLTVAITPTRLGSERRNRRRGRDDTAKQATVNGRMSTTLQHGPGISPGILWWKMDGRTPQNSQNAKSALSICTNRLTKRYKVALIKIIQHSTLETNNKRKIE